MKYAKGNRRLYGDQLVKSLNSYIARCLVDAYAAENRELTERALNKTFLQYVVVNGVLVLDLFTPYARVVNRVLSRIKRNIPRLFGLELAALGNDTGYSLDKDKHVSFNFAQNAIVNKVTGKQMYLLHTKNAHTETMGDSIPAFRYEKLCEQREGRKLTTEDFKEVKLPYDMTWNEYRELYKETFNEYPEYDFEAQFNCVDWRYYVESEKTDAQLQEFRELFKTAYEKMLESKAAEETEQAGEEKAEQVAAEIDNSGLEQHPMTEQAEPEEDAIEEPAE